MLDVSNPKSWRVLIVDDEADNLNLVGIVMEFHGAEVIKAGDGLEGLEKARDMRPNLILMDLSMPQMDGWAFLAELRGEDDLARIPVIALTAHAMDGDRERVIDAGFDGYISKPLQIATLVQDIERQLYY